MAIPRGAMIDGDVIVAWTKVYPTNCGRGNDVYAGSFHRYQIDRIDSEAVTLR